MKILNFIKKLNVAWIPLGAVKTTVLEQPKIIHKKLELRLWWLYKRLGKKELCSRLNISDRTLRSYYWILRRERKKKWDRYPSKNTQERINQLYLSLTKLKRKMVITEIEGIYFDAIDFEDLRYMFDILLNEAKRKKLEAFHNKYIRKIQYNQMYFDISIINLKGEEIKRDEIFLSLFARERFDELLRLTLDDMKQWGRKIRVSGLGFNYYRMGVKYYAK